jgi:hypothetical protein
VFAVDAAVRAAAGGTIETGEAEFAVVLDALRAKERWDDGLAWLRRCADEVRTLGEGLSAAAAAFFKGAFYTLVPIRPRSRGERRSLRTLPGASLRPPPAFNPRPQRLSTPTDAFELHPDIALYGTTLKPRRAGVSATRAPSRRTRPPARSSPRSTTSGPNATSSSSR